MNFRLLSLSQMVTLSAPWVQGGQQHELFTKVPVLAALAAELEEVHAQAVQQKEISDAQALSDALTQEMGEVDVLHDHAVRATWYGLMASSEALRAKGPAFWEQAGQLERMRDTLMPDGLRYVRRTYLDEAGNAARLEAQITPAIAERLKSLSLLDGSILEVARLWIAHGTRLGNLDRQRSVVVAEGAIQPRDSQIRLRWSALVDQILNLLDVVKVPLEVATAIRQPVIDAVALAEARLAARQRAAARAAEQASSDAENDAADGEEQGDGLETTGTATDPAAASMQGGGSGEE